MTEQNPTVSPSMAVFERGFILRLHIDSWGNNVRIDSEKAQADNVLTKSTDPRYVKMRKQLLVCEPYQEIASLDSKIRAFVNANKVLRAAVGRGEYLIPKEKFLEVDEKIEVYKVERKAKVKVFLGVYDAEKDKALADLNVLGNPRDYPTREQMAREFGVYSRWRKEPVDGGVPVELKDINPAIYQREIERQKNETQTMFEDVRLALRASFKQLVDNMIERLTDQPGKRRIIRDASIEPLRRFFDEFSVYNVTGDNELELLAARARQVIDGTDPKTLREESDVRQYVRENLAQVQASISKMVVDAPSRKIAWDE